MVTELLLLEEAKVVTNKVSVGEPQPADPHPRRAKTNVRGQRSRSAGRAARRRRALTVRWRIGPQHRTQIS
eukprot:1848276-Prymnesium_polylepis.1